MPEWMIYGATGYTGQLVAEEAVRCGHKPLLVGRSLRKLKLLADRLKLEYAVAPIEDHTTLEATVRRVKLVYHAAGPFVHTSEPMVRACLAARAHYLDITGETAVYQAVYQHDEAAKEKEIALLPGIGFDFLPIDCLIKYVVDQLPDANQLVTAVGMIGAGAMPSISAGTAKSLLEILYHTGSVVRRNGKLVPIPVGAEARRFQFPAGERLAMPIPWGDLEMGFRTTNIPNMTSYLAMPPLLIRLTRLTGGLLIRLLQYESVRNVMSDLVGRMVAGPDKAARTAGSSTLYAQVQNAQGERREARLETIESYQFTAAASIPVVEHVLSGHYCGALTPSQAFGADFVLNVGGTKRSNGPQAG